MWFACLHVGEIHRVVEYFCNSRSPTMKPETVDLRDLAFLHILAFSIYQGLLVHVILS